MPKIKSCVFNIDTACVDVVYDNGEMLSIYTVAVEDEFETNFASKSRLDWLIDNEPLTYVKLILSDEMQDYLDRYSKNYYSTESNIRKNLEKKFSPEQARQIAREFMMYDS